MVEIEDAVSNLVGLSSHTDTTFDAAKVRSYVERMVELIRSDPETLGQIGDPVHSVMYHAFRFEPHYAHLADYCAGRLPEPITIEACNQYLRAWYEVHKR